MSSKYTKYLKCGIDLQKYMKHFRLQAIASTDIQLIAKRGEKKIGPEILLKANFPGRNNFTHMATVPTLEISLAPTQPVSSATTR
jgi:hypothetical protein